MRAGFHGRVVVGHVNEIDGKSQSLVNEGRFPQWSAGKSQRYKIMSQSLVNQGRFPLGMIVQKEERSS